MFSKTTVWGGRAARIILEVASFQGLRMYSHVILCSKHASYIKIKVENNGLFKNNWGVRRLGALRFGEVEQLELYWKWLLFFKV